MNSIGTLRPIRDDEIELMRSWRNAPDVRSKMYTRHEISQAEHQSWWTDTKARSDRQYFMYEHAGTPLGIVGFTMIDTTSRNCAWAFYAAPDAPRGTGSRMEFLALEHVFGHLQLHKLYCEVLATNQAVVRLHQKFGFTIEGTLRDQHRMDDGFVDVIRLGLLAMEWADKREAMLARLQQQART